MFQMVLPKHELARVWKRVFEPVRHTLARPYQQLLQKLRHVGVVSSTMMMMLWLVTPVVASRLQRQPLLFETVAQFFVWRHFPLPQPLQLLALFVVLVSLVLLLLLPLVVLVLIVVAFYAIVALVLVVFDLLLSHLLVTVTEVPFGTAFVPVAFVVVLVAFVVVPFDISFLNIVPISAFLPPLANMPLSRLVAEILVRVVLVMGMLTMKRKSRLSTAAAAVVVVVVLDDREIIAPKQR